VRALKSRRDLAGALRGLAPRSSGSSHPTQSVPEPWQAPRRHPPDTGRPCLPTTVRHAASPLQGGDYRRLISPTGYPKQFHGDLLQPGTVRLVGEGSGAGCLGPASTCARVASMAIGSSAKIQVIGLCRRDSSY
jgi:hypothetical protein